jgi:hypothetical protein
LTSLASLLEQESRKRGCLSADEPLTVERAFALVRDMPYRRASSRKPEATIEEWRGTCSGKHYLLADLFRELGLESQVIMCTHRFTAENTGHFPVDLRELVSVSPVPDVHTYLRVNTAQGWTVVDATWPSSAGPLGMTVNREFRPGSDMTVACDAIGTLPVPEGRDPQEFKEELIADFCGANSKVRDNFIEGMGRWLGEST